MNSINLLPKKSLDEGKLTTIKKWVKLVTSIVLIVYIVVAAGIVGWWLFVASVDSVTARQKAELETEIKQNSTVEALLRQADLRQQLITSFLAEKKSLASVATKISPQAEELAIESWKHTATVNILTARFEKVEAMEKYTERLKSDFPDIKINELTGKLLANWVSDIKL